MARSKRVVRGESASNGNGTLTVGRMASAAFGIEASASLGITADRKGNIGLALALNGGGGFPSAGIGGFVSANSAPSIFAQEGWGGSVGASGGPEIVAGGVEYNHGGALSLTFGLYPTIVEAHGEVGYTWVWGINVYDAAIDIVNNILSITGGS